MSLSSACAKKVIAPGDKRLHLGDEFVSNVALEKQPHPRTAADEGITYRAEDYPDLHDRRTESLPVLQAEKRSEKRTYVLINLLIDTGTAAIADSSIDRVGWLATPRLFTKRNR